MLVVISLLLTILTISCFYFYYSYYWYPRKLHRWYQNTLQSLGYKVLVYPYQPFKILLLQNQKHNEKQKADAFYDEKHLYPNYDVVLSNTSHQITLHLIKPRLLKYFYFPQKPVYFKSPINKYAFNMVLGGTLFMSQGQSWKIKKKFISDVFNFEFIKANIVQTVTIANQMLQEHQQANISSDMLRCEIKPLISDIISNIIVKCFFGGSIQDNFIQGKSINKYLSDILKQSKNQSNDKIVLLFGNNAYKYGLKKKYRILTQKIQKLKDQVKKIIDLRYQQLDQKKIKEQKHLVSLIEATYNEKKSNQKQSICEEEIIKEFCAFITASTDTTGNLLNMMVYYLKGEPQFEAKIRQKVAKVIVKDEDITYDNLRRIFEIDWLQNQTLRMYGPATSISLRQASENTYIDNIPIVQGTGIKIEMLGSHYNKQFFSDPFKFNPQRWKQMFQYDPFIFGGFGAGPRTCIGKHLALISTKILLIKLLQRYESIQIEGRDQVRFQLRNIYEPTPFTTILKKEKIKSQ